MLEGTKSPMDIMDEFLNILQDKVEIRDVSEEKQFLTGAFLFSPYQCLTVERLRGEINLLRALYSSAL